jgi:hypothetical protein
MDLPSDWQIGPLQLPRHRFHGTERLIETTKLLYAKNPMDIHPIFLYGNIQWLQTDTLSPDGSTMQEHTQSR